MLIINADDWGRTPVETESALECYRHRRITAVSAMVFMRDSERAARIALNQGIDVGLHINFSQEFDQPGIPASLCKDHSPVVRFMLRSRFAIALYNPLLRENFVRTFYAQWNEFVRLYGTPPSHVDGHQHRHLCANALVDRFIPAGLRLRRNFTYARGERGSLNLVYRKLVDGILSHRYRLTDSFFSLGEVLRSNRLSRVMQAARNGTVELMVHPVNQLERSFLLGNEFVALTSDIDLGSFSTS